LNYTINEYRGHKCQGYNIDCNFFCNENYVITGSEDSNIYIYDTLSANIVAKYKTHQKCVNLVISIIYYFIKKTIIIILKKLKLKIFR